MPDEGPRERTLAAGGHARETLRAAGLRVTPQRVAVLDALGDAGGEHLSADDVWQRLATVRSTMDRSTAYRVLADLADAGLLTQVRFADGVARFEMQSIAHHHAVCVRCGGTQDIPAVLVRPLAVALGRAMSFNVALDEPLFVRGTCGRCASSVPRSS